jgi:methyl-accepting chemotaxis protein
VSQVEAIQGDTRQAIEAIARIAEVIEQINDHQGNIASTVEEQSATTQEMTRSIAEAATGVTSIAANIGDVASTVQTTTTETERAGQAAGELEAVSNRLRELVGRFRYTATG